jgi:RHH-type proline utilization regulon transcriptional repressor/proline dehydrogenase/delta 1-pyrroline-5-carboxylate dehydrogenase
MHTRVDSRVERVVKRIRVGNIYINRNQIGAVVGTQPFGGEGLSGTGPKAGGPWYLPRFTASPMLLEEQPDTDPVSGRAIEPLLAKARHTRRGSQPADMDLLQRIAQLQGLEWQAESIVGIDSMPGPTGETNQLSAHPRGVVLCLGPGRETALAQALSALAQENRVLVIADDGAEIAELLSGEGLPVVGADGCIEPALLGELEGIDAVMSQAQADLLREYRIALAERDGKLIPLICETGAVSRLVVERHLCIDTTAAGGNASLIASVN